MDNLKDAISDLCVGRVGAVCVCTCGVCLFELADDHTEPISISLHTFFRQNNLITQVKRLPVLRLFHPVSCFPRSGIRPRRVLTHRKQIYCLIGNGVENDVKY